VTVNKEKGEVKDTLPNMYALKPEQGWRIYDATKKHPKVGMVQGKGLFGY
jgi:hypothetical protein